MNEYTKDGLRLLKRASFAMPGVPNDGLDPLKWKPHAIGDAPLDPDTVSDSILYFAFGMEKLLKGILVDVNPLFIFEKPELSNICGVLYRTKMTFGLGKAFDEKDNNGSITRDVHTAGTSLGHAKYFSQSACNHASALNDLFGYRGIIAHRTLLDLPPHAIRFVQKEFSPIVEAFIEEQKLDPTLAFLAGRREFVKKMSEQLYAEDNFKKSMDEYVKAQKKVWDDRKADATKTALATAQSQLAERADYGREKFSQPVVCPVCGQRAILICEVDGEYMDGEAVTTGAFVVAMKCHYCDSEVSGYEKIDYLKLDELLYSTLT